MFSAEYLSLSQSSFLLVLEGATTLTIMTLVLSALGITTLSIASLITAQQNIFKSLSVTLGVVMLSVVMANVVALATVNFVCERNLDNSAKTFFPAKEKS
jgi:hypothetical protein